MDRPREDRAARPSEEIDTPESDGVLRAMVVEDDPGFRALLDTVLRKRGLETAFFEVAEEAHEAFAEAPYDIALVDHHLPGMTGVEFTGRLRQLPGGEDTVVVLITGDERTAILESALDAGADDYVAKPAEPPTLNIRLAIAERRARQARAQRKALDAAARDAFTDSLTGLATRALLLNRIQGGINRSTREESYLFGVIHLDLDAFHRLNSRLGQEMADEVLVEVARRLGAALRVVDTPARLGADEFAIFLDDLREESDVARVTNRIRQAFAEPIRVRDQNVFISASMGISLGGPEYRDAEGVLREAAKALRRAKSEGSGSVRIFDPVLHERASEEVKREGEIRKAIEEDQMVLHYQPILSLTTPAIVGFEALMRWPLPEGGFVPAGEFIPLVERSGLVVHMGWWTLNRACRQLLEWHGRYPTDPPVAVMVNVPGRQFSEPELVPTVIQILEDTGLSPEHLHLEITETSAMSDLDWSLRTLHALREVGVHLHVDDFGTGHSSLSYLQRFPVDSLKIDRSFVAGMAQGPENVAIVRTVVDLGRSLGLTLVAEGIETPEELALLRQLGCDYGQGWLFSKALDPEQVEAVLENPEPILKPLL